MKSLVKLLLLATSPFWMTALFIMMAGLFIFSGYLVHLFFGIGEVSKVGDDWTLSMNGFTRSTLLLFVVLIISAFLLKRRKG